MAADIFEYSKRVGYHFSLLDIGGGFPGTRDSQDLFRRVTGAINQGLEKHFSALPGLKIIAEPGGERGSGDVTVILPQNKSAGHIETHMLTFPPLPTSRLLPQILTF